jgi:hypothetical protein
LIPGRIAVDAGPRLYSQARELILAAACAAIEPRSVYANRKPERALDYLRHAQLAPPEPGSFVITIESPVQPQLQGTLDLYGVEPPFERAVMLSLARTAEQARQAVAETSASGSISPFVDRVSKGVSANFCEALSGLLSEHPGGPLGLRFHWSPAWPVEDDVPRRVRFGADSASVLESVARGLRDRAPVTGFEIVGPVRKLESQDPAFGGSVTVSGLIDGVARLVKLELPADDYQIAVRAHGERALIRCEGELVRERGALYLKTPRFFSILEEK